MIKKLAAYIKEYKSDSIKAPLFVSLEVIMEVILPLLMAMIIDEGLDKNNMSVVFIVGILMIVAALVSLGFGVLSGKHAAIASAGFAKNLRQAVYYKIQDFSFTNIDKFSTSSLVTRLTTDISNVQQAYQMIIRILVRSPMMMIFSVIMAMRISGSLSMIFFIAIPFLGFSLLYIMQKTHPNFMRMFKKYDLVNQVVQENLISIRTVKSYVREDYEIDKFEGATGELYQYSINAEKLLALNSPIMQTTVYACMMAVSWFGAKLVVSETMTTGQLMSMFTYVMQILSSLMMVSMVFIMTTMAKTCGERIIEVLEEESDIVGGETLQVQDGSIEFSNVSFSYTKDKNKLALVDVNVTIPSGTTVGIIGSTGSGKSTMVSLIPRLYDIDEGSLKIGGKDIKDYDLKVLRDEVSVVLQKNVLFSGTIKDNLRWGDKNASDEDIVRVCKLAQADGFISKFPKGYDTYIEQGGTNVSGGQKQRLCIARALLKKPKILILDDSTSAVDTKTDALIRKAFKEEIPDTTKIIIAQRISSVQDADMIIVLNEGRVDAIGDHETLLKTNTVYQEVYNSQIKGGDKDE